MIFGNIEKIKNHRVTAMYKKKILTALAVASAGIAGVMQAEVKLVDPVYDFGVISEAAGPRTGYAHIVNLGPDTTYIADVRPSCGCTGAKFYSEPVAPGDTTEVSFTYDPKGRPGHFEKTVKIYTGDERLRHIVRMRGTVVGTPESLRRNYPVECGRIRLSDTHTDLGKVRADQGRHTFVRIVNASMDTVRPLWVNNDSALSIDITPKELTPGDLATLGVYLNTRFEKRRGPVEYVIPVKVEGDTATVAVRIIADIIEPVSEESEKSAKSDR